jgi:ABC-type branched-subunit amino acid transport system substrate-binding protein
MGTGGLGGPLPVIRRARTAGGTTFVYPVPPPPTNQLRRGLAIAAGVVIVLASTTGLVIARPWASCGIGQADIERDGADCVGVTDGGYVFASPLESVERAIAKENQTVQPPYVSIAYLGPMTSADEPSSAIKRQLEGAYAAQLASNQNGGAFKVRLLLANDGTRDAHWGRVVQQLRDRTDANGPDHLVAVVGLGLPSAATDGEVRELHQQLGSGPYGIPVVAMSLPAGDLHGQGLVSISPTDTAEIDAAIAAANDYEKRNPTARGRAAVIVQDGDSYDHYASGLGTLFARQRGLTQGETLSYGSGATDFPAMVRLPAICPGQAALGVKPPPPPLIYFAGPGRDLINFAQALANRCFATNAEPIQILTGPDAVSALDASYRPPKTETITYTGRAARVQGSQPFQATYEQQLRRFQDDPSDEQAIQAFDAIWVVANAVKELGTGPVTPGLVQTSLGTGDVLSGVGGSIQLDASGSRVNVAVHVMQIQPDGTVCGVASPGVVHPCPGGAG